MVTEKRPPQTKSRHMLQSLTQLRATSAEHLAFCLDAALAASNSTTDGLCGLGTVRPRTIRPFIVKEMVFHCLLEVEFFK